MPFLLVILMLCAVFPIPSAAQDPRPVLAQHDGLTLSIYDSGFTLVQDSRRARLLQGQTPVAFAGVSPRMAPASAFVTAPTSVNISSLIYDFEVLTADTLLQRSVGLEVDIVRTHPSTGEETREPARILSVKNGIVLRYRDRIDTHVPGRLVFREVPADLRTEPTMIADVRSDVAGDTRLALNYLTEGLEWHADYVVEVMGRPERLSLVGRALITNTAGVDFPKARVSLIAGSVRREHDSVQPRALQAMATRLSEAAPGLNSQSFSDVHMYEVPDPLAVDNGQTRQITLLRASEIPVRLDYVSERSVSPHRARSAPVPEHPEVRYAFQNSSAEGLGAPLPAGVARLYRRDGHGVLRLLGEDRIAHTPKGQKIELVPSEAFDITVTRRQTEYAQVGAKDSGVSEMAWEIDIHNAKDTDATVTLIEIFPTPWTMLEETVPHQKQTAQRAVWHLKVPADGQTRLNYRVRTGS